MAHSRLGEIKRRLDLPAGAPTALRAWRRAVWSPLMVERVTEMPQGTLGLRVSGRIERSDYEEVLAPELRAAVEVGRVRALFVLERVDGMEPAALWADLKLFFEVAVGRHRAAWERTAIVTDIGWMASVARAVVGIIPGQVLVYPQSQLDTAKAWVASGVG